MKHGYRTLPETVTEILGVTTLLLVAEAGVCSLLGASNQC